jgi:hypothetical protein
MDGALDEALLNLVPMPADEVAAEESSSVDAPLDQALLDLVPFSVPEF